MSRREALHVGDLFESWFLGGGEVFRMWVVFAHLASAVDGVEHFPGLILHIVVTVKKKL